MQTGFCLCKQGQVVWGTEFRSHIIQAFVPSEFVLGLFEQRSTTKSVTCLATRMNHASVLPGLCFSPVVKPIPNY